MHAAAAERLPLGLGRGWRFARFLRALGVGGMAGAVAGILAGGLGSRIAMRIVSLASRPEAIGQITENGNRVGDITLEGTLGLALFGGLFFGVPGGLAWMAVRPWMARFGGWRGLVFGLGLLAAVGAGLVDAGNRDFQRFGTPALNVALFASLFPLFGLMVVPVASRLDRWLPAVPPRRPFRLRTIPGYGLLGLFGAMSCLLALQGIARTTEFGGEPGALASTVLLYLLIVVPLARLILARLRGDERPGPAGYAVLGLPVAAGLVLTVGSVLEILR